MKFRDLCPELADLERYDGHLDISHEKLTFLDGCPKEINGYFDCGYNQLSSLVGGPEKVNGAYWCHDNKLTSLNGIASYILGDLNFEHTDIESIKGIHKQIKFYGGAIIWISESTTKGLLDLFLMNAPNLKYLNGNAEIDDIFARYFKLIRQGEMSNLEAMLECQSCLIENDLDVHAE